MAGTKKKKNQKRKKIVRFSGGLHLNIGIIVFLFIGFYLIYNVYSYFTAVHIRRYEVGQGTIEVNTSYTGLILRSETVVNAQQSGNLDYYLKDNTKAACGTLVCSVDENGNVSEKLDDAADISAVMTEENLHDIQSSIREYAKGCADSTFYAVYNFKADLSGRLMEAMNLGALDAISDYTQYAQDNQTFHLYRAEQPGVAVFYTDGMEEITAESIRPEYFDAASYQKYSLKTEGAAEAGQPLYKLITDENWQIVIPVDETVKDTLADSGSVQIRFKEDHASAWADCSFFQKGGQDYLLLNLSNSMIRYANERYADIQILLDQQSGLKIPNSAITTKTFELVPDAYITKGSGASDQDGLLVERLQQDGSYAEAEFVPVTVYYKDEEEMISYISEENIKRGDRIVLTGSTQRYEIAKTAKLRGVYNINRGYAVFRQIEELYSNNNYTIIKEGTPFGITLYDFIALEGDTVTENQMIT